MFDHCLYFNTTALARVIEREWTRAFAELGLTPPQGFMLRLVLDRPGLRQHQVAAELDIARPTATRLLDGLEAKQLIERRTSATDGRELEVYPTVTAHAYRLALNAASGSVTRRIKGLVGGALFDDTVAQLRQIRTALK